MSFLNFLGVVLGISFAVTSPFLAYGWIRNRNAARLSPGAEEELQELRARMAELDGVSERVAELEERVDFAERMLSQANARAELPPKGS